MKDYESRDLLFIERAEGVFLYDGDDQRYYDTNSSWWVNIHGHSHPRIQKVMQQQLKQLDHVMFSGLTHRPGILLAEKLVKITPPGLEKVFYSDNGSTAIEIATKMSFQYWQQMGKPEKTKFLFLENGYHGDTIGAMSLGGIDGYHALFSPLYFTSYALPTPSSVKGLDASVNRVEAALAAAEERLIANGNEIAALIVEPMIQMAGGIQIYPANYLKGLSALCSKYQVHMIADEVAVGFGRTGKMFASEYAEISPDFMCLSKGITAGVLPLAATLCTDEIYQAFYDDFARRKTFTHGHSYTGNPLATAIALESLQIFEDENVLQQVNENAVVLQEELTQFTAFYHVAHIRQLGLIAAFDLVADRESGKPFPASERIGFKVFEQGLSEGLLLRPLGDTIYFVLPLCITKQQIVDIMERTRRVLGCVES